MGKLAERVLDGLLELGGTAKLEQLSAHLQRPQHHLEKPLTSPNFHQEIDFTSSKDTVTLAPKWQEAFLEAAKRTGTPATLVHSGQQNPYASQYQEVRHGSRSLPLSLGWLRVHPEDYAGALRGFG